MPCKCRCRMKVRRTVRKDNLVVTHWYCARCRHWKIIREVA